MSEEGQKRLPRFKRANAGRLQITDRDISILTYVHKYHFLSSNHIASLAGGSSQQIRRRLQLLFHNGYLERPKAQLDYFAQSGTQPMVYGLGTKGAQLISKYNKRAEGARDWSYKNKKVGRVFLDHTLAVADVMVSFELLCRATEGVSLIGQAAILKELPATALVQNNPHRFEARVGAQGKATSMALVPDGVFALEYQAAGGQERENFFLEVDRGTMPVERRNLRGSSIYKKLLINHAGWREGRHTKQYGWQHFRVLTVTNSQERVGHMVSVAKRLNNGRGSRLFLFADDTCLSADTLPQKEWLDGRGETVTLNAE